MYQIGGEVFTLVKLSTITGMSSDDDPTPNFRRRHSRLLQYVTRGAVLH